MNAAVRVCTEGLKACLIVMGMHVSFTVLGGATKLKLQQHAYIFHLLETTHLPPIH